MTPRILVIDDEPELLASLRKILGRRGAEVVTAGSGEEGLLRLQDETPPHLVLTDLRMPGGLTGLDVLRTVKRRFPDVPVVLITGHATLDSAIAAIREGAYDYLPKPFGPEQLLVVVERALDRQRLADENRRLRARLGGEQQGPPEDGIIGQSEAIGRLRELVRRVGPTELGVLITGESGTGKEVVAQALHAASRRADRAFIPVDCAAIPPSLMESELFGHEKGAFTGAAGTRKGLVEAAEGGTFFLDEIGELPMPVQVKLLRLLQERQFRRVGGTKIFETDVRVVAATNRSLDQMVAAGTFREDLFHRLNVVHIHLPPLRDRREDIPVLLKHFVDRAALEVNRDELRLDPDAVDVLTRYEWPGNVRELVNCARYVVGLAPGSVIRAADLPPRIRDAALGPRAVAAAPAAEGGGLPGIRYDLPYKRARRLWLEIFETAYIIRLLQEHGGNVSQAARASGIDRKSIQRLMKRNDMENPGRGLDDDEDGEDDPDSD